MESRSRVEIVGNFFVKHSGKILQSAKNTYVETFDLIEDETNFIVRPRPKNFVFSVSPSTLNSLNGEILNVTFAGTVTVTSLDPRNAQELFMKCFAESNIDWFWKSGISQPDNKVDGVATVLSNQYQTKMNQSENFDILMSIYVNFTTAPQEPVERKDNGQTY